MKRKPRQPRADRRRAREVESLAQRIERLLAELTPEELTMLGSVRDQISALPVPKQAALLAKIAELVASRKKG